jgi:hypothetical protein
MTENSGGKQEVACSGRFRKGQSGNPRGKPKGCRHHATRIAQAFLDGQAAALVAKAVEVALQGDVAALRVCMERLVPPRKDAPVSITLPVVRTTADLPGASQAILQAVADGQLTPSEAQAIAGIIADHRKNLEVGDLEARVAILENRPRKGL